MRALKVGALLVAAALVAAACESTLTTPKPTPQPQQPGPVQAQPYAPQAAPIAMIPADKRTSEQWMEYLGVRLVEQRDPSGPDAWAPEPGRTYFFTNESTTWGATNTRNNVVVFDAATKKVVTQSNLPDEYALGYASHGVAVSADAKWIYLPALGKRNFTLVIDARTFRIAKVYESLGRPHHVNNFTAPNGKELIMVVDFGWSFAGSGVYVLDPSQDNKIVGGMGRADFSGHPYVVSGEVEGKFLFATVPAPTSSLREHMEGYLAKIDMATWKVVGSVPMIDPIWPEISADGKTAWVTLGGPSKVAQVDLTKLQLVREVTTGPGPWGARLSYDGTKLYVADKGEAGGYGQQGRTLTIIDTAIPIVTNVVPIGVTTDHTILSPDGKEIWATSNADHAIYVIDLATEKVTAVAKMPNNGDTHGSTFVRYEKTDKGVAGQVVSSFTGLRGTAKADQAKALAESAATVVKLDPRGTQFDPATLTLKPGKQFIRFVNSSGTGAGPGTVESAALGIARFELKPGESKVVEVTIPQSGTFNVTSPSQATIKPLVITAGAASQAPQQTGPRPLTLSSTYLQFDQKSFTAKVGETLAITFKNDDDEKHNLVVLETTIVSPDLPAGRTSTFNFTGPAKAGTFKVICAYHPAMTLELKVNGQ